MTREVDMMWWYVLFVHSNMEDKVINDLKKYVATLSLQYKVEPFILESEQYYRNKQYQKQGNKYLRRPLYPGYVFVETDMPDVEFIRVFYYYINKSSSIIRLLTSNNANKLAISAEEKARLEYWSLGRRCLSHSTGYINGDKVIIVTGPLVGKEGIIKRINRHNRCAYVELDFLGQKQIVKMALEIIDKKQ